MAISRERFDAVRSRWGDYSSWAVWPSIESEERPKARIGDLSVLDLERNDGVLELLNPNIVFLGLNAATRAINQEPWSNFHDGRGVANDFKIRHALEKTRYWGSYMTDVFVGLHETDSSKVAAHSKASPGVVIEQIRRLEEELQDIGSNDPLLIAFGGTAYNILRKHLGGKYSIIKITHYAYRINKERYQERVRGEIAAGTARLAGRD